MNYDHLIMTQIMKLKNMARKSDISHSTDWRKTTLHHRNGDYNMPPSSNEKCVGAFYTDYLI